MPISNLQFLRAIFGDLPPDELAWCTAFEGDPGEVGHGDWRGFGVRPEDPLAKILPIEKGAEQKNTFTTFSTFRGEFDAFSLTFVAAGRRKSLCAAMYAAMLDDIGAGPGAKIPRERLAGLPPSWELETSPGNFQVGYILREPERDASRASRFLDALVHEGLQEEKDPGMKGVTRYGRLPVGINTKAKYGGWVHRLTVWEPDRRYSLEEIAEAYGLELPQEQDPEPAQAPVSVAVEDDPWYAVVAMAGLLKDGEIRDKGSDGAWADIVCPWVDAHTGQEDTGSAYAIGGGFQCHHGHCEGKTGQHLRRWLTDHSSEAVRKAAAAALFAEDFPGLDLDSPAPPLEEWVGFESLERRARELDPGAVDPMRELVASAAGAGLDAAREEILVDQIAESTRLTKKVIRAEWKKVVEDLQEQERQAQAQAQAQQEANDTRPGLPVLPLILPGGWRHVDGEGHPKPTGANVERLMQQAAGRIRLNEMTRRTEYSGSFDGLSGDWVIGFLHDACEVNGLKIAAQRLVSIVRQIAEEEAYHPFQEYLRGLEGTWDRTKRLPELYATIQVSKNPGLRDLILERWLMSIVAAGRHWYRGRRGAQPRGVLVFVGRQYAGKTTWLGRLFPPALQDCFQGGAHFTGDTDSKLAVLSALVTELGEIDSTFNRSELGQLKAFISGDSDTLRKPYGYEHITLPRRTILAGTVNSTQFLRDTTGNTRFWPIEVTSIDLDKQRELDMDQIWAELQHKVRTALEARRGSDTYLPLPWLMSQDESLMIERANEQYRVKSAAELALVDAFDWDDKRWKKARFVDEKLQINPMKYSEIVSRARHGQSGGAWSREWLEAIRLLTKQDRPRKTEITYTDSDGQKRTKKGDLYGMPPVKNSFEEFDE